MKYSIIMPLYNGEKTLQRAVYSVMNQTILDWELIIVDDKSTDSSLDLAKKLANLNIKISVLVNDINSGPAKARNKGIKNAKGKYIAFLDCDDYWHPQKLEICNFYNKYDLTYSNYYLNNQNKKIEKIKVRALKECNVFYDLLEFGNPICNSSVVLKKGVIEKIGFLKESKYYYSWEDFELWLRIAEKKFTFYHIDEYLVYYYRGNHNITTLNREIINWIKLKNEYRNLANQQMLNRLNKSIGINYLKAEKYKNSIPYLKTLIIFGNLSDRLKSIVRLVFAYFMLMKKFLNL